MTEKLSNIIVCEHCGRKNQKDAVRCVNCGNQLYPDYYKGLWLKNTITTLIIFLLPFVILFYLVNFEISTHFENQVKEGLNYSVTVNARAIESFLAERKTDLLSIATLDIASIDQVTSETAFFERFIIENPWFDCITIVDTERNVVYATNTIKAQIDDGIYFTKALQGEFHNSGIFYSEVLDTVAMIIASPLFNRHNTIIGVILATISLKTFYNLLVDLRIGETSEIFLVDETGLFLSPSRLGGKVHETYGHYTDEPNPHTDQGRVLIHRDYRGEEVFCSYRRSDELNWYLVSEMDVDEALAPATRLKNVMLSIFLVFGGFLLISSLIFAKQITNLLKNLTSTLKSALDDLSTKKNTINTINVELRERLGDCEQLSQQLQLSEEYIKNIINSISSGLIALDKNLNITYCNEFVKNFSEKDTIKMNTNVYAAFPILNNKKIKHQIQNIFTVKDAFRIRKISVVHDNQNIILSIAGFPIMEGDDISGATLLINDITEQELLHAQMADYEKLSALSQLALGAAHEINNPLLGITSYIELLLEEEEDVEKKTRAKEVLDSANRISETIRGLLNFARPTPPKFTKIGLNRLISETLSFLHHQPLFRKMKIEKILSDAVPQVTADANQIRQILINIVINAAQAMPDGGTLTVTTGKVKFEEFVEIRIADTGTGISEDDLKNVFDPFFTTKKGEGTGLGLSISYSYIKNHSGEIKIRSTVGKGTEVTIRLPIRQKVKVQSEVIE